MSLVQVDKATITSATANADLTGITDNSAYMLTISNFVSDASSGGHAVLRVLNGGSPDTTSNYDAAEHNIRTDASYTTASRTNTSFWYISHQLSTTTQSQHNSIIYLYNFYDSNEYSYIVNQPVDWRSTSHLFSRTGAAYHTVNQSNNGVRVQTDYGNILKAEITLYKITGA